ncbi:galactose-1-phosphate uridylyltransferase [Choiromyces venosus 120613-1]|uniref:Galactose-1-phosphate uridylyltransferase n=1 Tax=Choiromyces venosus 120613-1 TaxID=1336337 RepID=A0A3N4IVF4_9PEZI|nr:galactose-1-phosphate uridylyltransferase [Choiromyces venosus 120613-1]RPA92940.1 galactose-1-phosphate uridylyltransferase [Choiromyces venosus 120613-1]
MNDREVLDDISHRRYNPLRGSWILVSPHRTKRPWQGQKETPSKTSLPAFDSSCYLCPRNVRAAGDTNPAYPETFVFVNDYSAVKEEQPDYVQPKSEDKSSLLLQATGVRGKCYVICFNPSHNLTLADLPAGVIVPIIKTWTILYASHLPKSSPYYQVPAVEIGITTPRDQYTYMQIFENKGAAMGCSNPHPHGQVWTTTGIPEEPGLEIQNMKEYKRKYGTGLLKDYVDLEITKEIRIVALNGHFAAVCPWWAVWPFETMIICRREVHNLPELTEEEQEGLAEMISIVTKKYDNLFETNFPYSMGIHQAPLDCDPEDREACHLHLHFTPPLLRSATVRKFLVGYELMAEPQRDITPEQAAGRLRNLRGDEVYRKKLMYGTEA